MTPSLISEIQARNDQFREATRRGDAAGLPALYTGDAWLLPPGAPGISGRAGIEEFWRARLERIEEVMLTANDVVGIGPDWAREVGTSSLKLKGQMERVSGKYVVVWRRLGGEWQLEADAFNSDS